MIAPEALQNSHLTAFASSLTKEKDKIYRDMAFVLRWTGLRIREFVTLQKSNCSFGVNMQDKVEYHFARLNFLGKGSKPASIKTYDKFVIDIFHKRFGKCKQHLFFPELDDLAPKSYLTQAASICNKISKGFKRRVNKWFGVDVGPHGFRRTFAADLHCRGVKTEAIQQLMRHSSFKDTSAYIGGLALQQTADEQILRLSLNPNFYANKSNTVAMDTLQFTSDDDCDDEDDDQLKVIPSLGSSKVKRTGKF